MVFILVPLSEDLGLLARSACVYGWAGRSNISSTEPDSTTRPAYITDTLSHISATTPRLWVMKMTDVLLSFCSFLIRSSI